MTKAEAIAILKRIQEPEAWEPQINQVAFKALDMAIEALSQESSEDVISRQAAIEYLMTNMNWYDEDGYESDDDYKRECITELINGVPSAQPEQRWIPFKTRPLTKEEKEEHPEWDGILDCKLPDDGQRILVNVSVRGHESVQYDEFYTDDGSYLDSGYEIGTEATAWMPLPEPYMGTRSDTSDRRKD